MFFRLPFWMELFSFVRSFEKAHFQIGLCLWRWRRCRHHRLHRLRIKPQDVRMELDESSNILANISGGGSSSDDEDGGDGGDSCCYIKPKRWRNFFWNTFYLWRKKERWINAPTLICCYWPLVVMIKECNLWIINWKR